MTNNHNNFVDRDTLMRYHYGLGVGHVYAHEARIIDRPYSGQGTSSQSIPQSTAHSDNEHSEREETSQEITNWQGSNNDEDEEDDEDDAGIEEANFFEQE